MGCENIFTVYMGIGMLFLMLVMFIGVIILKIYQEKMDQKKLAEIFKKYEQGGL